MGSPTEWSKEAWESSVSSRCWEFTPYDAGWDSCPELRADEELHEIVAMERVLGEVPKWAKRIVESSIRHVPFCGSYHFPRAFLEALDAIGAQEPPAFVHGCFTVDAERKRVLQDYCFCLDAWLAGAPSEDAAAELKALGARRVDWDAVCRDLWEVLGEHTEMQELLVERLLHFLRHYIKFAIWDNDRASKFCRDQYLGTISTDPSANEANVYAHAERAAPGCDEAASPRVRRIEARLAEICPDWERFRMLLLWEWWLCAPKAFRFLERKLWFIGQGSPLDPEGFQSDGQTAAWWKAFLAADVPGFLRCEDTYPNQHEAAAWYREFCAALDGWWHGKPQSGAVADDVNTRLGEDTPVKRWLVRLFLRRIRRIEENGEQFTNLVNPQHSHRRGTALLTHGPVAG